MYQNIFIMELKIVIKNTVFFILNTFLFNIAYSQATNEHYTLFKGGKKYEKIVGYVMNDSQVKKLKKNYSTIVYYIDQEMLIHRKGYHTASTINIKELKNINITTLSELGKLKDKEINLRLKESNIKYYPRPLNNNILKIYLLDSINCQEMSEIEVEWVCALK